MKTTTNNEELKAKESLIEKSWCKVPRVSFYYKKNTIRIAFYSLYCLGLPVYIRFLVNPEKKQFAVQASGKDDLTALKVDYLNQSEVRMRHVSALLVHQLFEMGNWNKKFIYRIEGKHIPKHNMVVFNLDEAVNASFKSTIERDGDDEE